MDLSILSIQIQIGYIIDISDKKSGVYYVEVYGEKGLEFRQCLLKK